MAINTMYCRTDFTLEKSYRKLGVRQYLLVACEARYEAKRATRIERRFTHFWPYVNREGKNVSGPEKWKFSSILDIFVFEHIDQLLMSASVWEIELVRDMVNAGPNRGVGRLGVTPPCPLLDVLQVKVRKKKNDEMLYYVLADELRMLIGRKAADLLEDKGYLEQAERLQFCRGLLTLYGILPMSKLITILDGQYPDNLELNRSVLVSTEMFMCYDKIPGFRGKAFMVSPFVRQMFEKPKDLMDMMHIGSERKIFTKEYVLAAGSHPMPIITTPEGEELKAVLKHKYHVKDAVIDKLLYDYWLEKQDKEKSGWEYTLFSELYLAIRFEEMIHMMDMVNAYVESVPCWIFAGNSVADTAKTDDSIRYRIRAIG